MGEPSVTHFMMIVALITVVMLAPMGTRTGLLLLTSTKFSLFDRMTGSLCAVETNKQTKNRKKNI